MRTCCSHCATVFRISAEQLRARNGMVRCGQCQTVFNAFDSLIDDTPPPPPPAPEKSLPVDALLPRTPPTPDAENPGASITVMSESLRAEDGALQEPASPEIPGADIPAASPPNPDETTEESVQAAREAGLATVRELSGIPEYRRWTSSPLSDLSETELLIEGKRSLWPFVVVLILLGCTLVSQLAMHYRGELVHHLPGLRGLYSTLNIAIPLPQQVDLVTIETSDLQSDAANGLLVLQATLKNRAPFAQAWPLLELTLTDLNDGVISRRALAASDYLPADKESPAFPANGEIGLKLWLESKLPAAGYRLYVFYP